MARSRQIPLVHPGEILREDLMIPLVLRINGADTALRLARYLAMTPQFWMNLQAAYDLDVATRASADRIKRDVHPREAA